MNADLVDQVKAHFVKQLGISEVLDGYTFDARIAADSSYPTKIKQLNLRLLVIRPFTQLENRDLADLVLFVKNGIATTLKNGYGPPVQGVAILNIHWSSFGKF